MSLIDTLINLESKEIPSQKLKRVNNRSLYAQTWTNGVSNYEYKGEIIKTHLPNNSNIKQNIVDQEGMIDISNPELEVVLKKAPTKFGDKQLKEILKAETQNGMMLYYPLPSINPKLFFNNIDWEKCLAYWINGGSTKDPRLVEAFKSCIMPLPDYDAMLYQPLNSHQIWVTNSGTGKSTFNMIYGNSPIQELTQAGLFGSNTNNYEEQYTGLLHGKGMLMVDEVSELTVSNKESAPLINLMLSYLEQGTVIRAFKKPVICRGTKTVILNSNPKSKLDPSDGIIEFVNVVGADDDKVRLGRRFGLLLFGNDFKTVDFSKPFPTRHIDFIRRVVKNTIAKNSKTIYTLFENNYKYISTPDNEMRQELHEISSTIILPELSELLEGLSMATAKIKTAAFRSFLIDHLDEISKKSTKKIDRAWKHDRDEYIATIHKINLESFKHLERVTVEEHEIETIKSLYASGTTQKDIGQKLNKSQQAISKVLKHERD